MKSATEKQGVLSRLLKDRRGNFGMMTALLLPVLLGAGGISIDMTKMMMTKNRLQDASDSAALAAASALANDNYSKEEAEQLGMTFLKTHMVSSGSLDEEVDEEKKDEEDPELELDSFSQSVVHIEESTTAGTGKSWVINVTAKMDVQLNPLTKLLYGEKTTVSANTTAESATESKAAISMYLVLDKSGSMLANTDEKNTKVSKCVQYDEYANALYGGRQRSPCYIKKIEQLKTAAGALFSYLDGADPTTKFVRTGTVSYDSSMRTAYDIAWGTTGARQQVNGLSAEGGTNSTAAMKEALKRLTASTESTEHTKVNGENPTRYIVFMTDGNNNDSRENGNTEVVCKSARDANIVIFSIAFMAPEGGQKLLRNCAGQDSRYFAPNDSKGLTDAFIAIGQQAAEKIARLTH